MAPAVNIMTGKRKKEIRPEQLVIELAIYHINE